MSNVRIELEFVIAHFFELGVKEVSVESLNKVVQLIQSEYREVDVWVTTSVLTHISEVRPNMFNYTDSEIGDVVKRGYWDEPRAFFDSLIRNIGLPKEQFEILKNGLVQIDDKILNEVFGVVFTPEYISKYIDCSVPEQYREDIIKIIHDYCQEHNLV